MTLDLKCQWSAKMTKMIEEAKQSRQYENLFQPEQLCKNFNNFWNTYCSNDLPAMPKIIEISQNGLEDMETLLYDIFHYLTFCKC